MKDANYTSKQRTEKKKLPVHSLEHDSKQINILPLDHTNPYDFKREHRHTYFEIMLIEVGGCNQLIDFKNYAGHNHSCYIICPQQIHLMNRNNSSGTVVQFTEDRISSAELRSILRQLLFYDNPAIIFENRPDLFEELQSLLDILSKHLSKNDATNNLVVTHLLQAFISLVIENSRLKDNSTKASDKRLLIDFYQLLELHYTNNLGVRYYIEKLGTTEKKLSESTKKHTGLSPLQVIHSRILLEAKRMLLFEELSHKEIAYQLGFDSPASFSSFIKAKTGQPPSELTKQLAEIHK
ncbi:MAG: helix-turn-helix domain-containing protein [Flavobacteriales bacterium]|nr:helix-turn-helix domain-containing protein [Flavobacteriales bacterium]